MLQRVAAAPAAMTRKLAPMTSVAALGSITVLMTVYNGRQYARRSISSVLAQTRLPQQVLVVDDGSTDDLSSLIESEFGDRVTLIRQPNGGLANARNHGLRLATGDYIAFLDVDDWWAPTKLAVQAELLDTRSDIVATYTSLTIVDEVTGEQQTHPAIAASHLWPLIRWENPALAPSSVMVRRTALADAGNFTEPLRTSEDWDCWFRLVRRGKFAEVSEPLTFYQLSHGGISNDPERMFESFKSILELRLLDGLTGFERAVWRRRILSFQAYKACLTARGVGDLRSERKFMWLSIRTWPSPFWAARRFKAFAVTALRSR